jgi:aminoglycoside phosphotransferase (APT) family kinase protein
MAHSEVPNPRLQGAVLDHFAAKYRARYSLRLKDFEHTSGGMHRAFLCRLGWSEAGEILYEDLVLRLFEGVDAAEDARREYAILSFLHGTEVPVPFPHFLEDRPEVAGCPFLAMARLDGESFPSSLDDLPGKEAESLANQFIANLAKLHSLDCGILGSDALSVPRPPYGAVDWKLTEFRYEAEYAVKERQEDIDLGWLYQRRDINTVLNWLQEHREDVPCKEYSLLHGDYQPANIVFADNEITGIIDWELARIGDPMEDLAYTLGSGIEDVIDRYGRIRDVDLRRVDYYQVYTMLLLLFALLAVRNHGSQKLGMKKEFFEAPGQNDEMLNHTYHVLQEKIGLSISGDPVVSQQT